MCVYSTGGNPEDFIHKLVIKGTRHTKVLVLVDHKTSIPAFIVALYLSLEDYIQVIEADDGIKIDFMVFVEGSLDYHFYDVFPFILSESLEEGEVIGKLGFEEGGLLLKDFL